MLLRVRPQIALALQADAIMLSLKNFTRANQHHIALETFIKLSYRALL